MMTHLMNRLEQQGWKYKDMVENGQQPKPLQKLRGDLGIKTGTKDCSGKKTGNLGAPKSCYWKKANTQERRHLVTEEIKIKE